LISADQLGDSARARALLERTIEADPRNDQAFTRLRKLLEQAGEIEAVTQLLGARLAGAAPDAVTALRLERVDLMLGPLNDISRRCQARAARAAGARARQRRHPRPPGRAGAGGRRLRRRRRDVDPPGPLRARPRRPGGLFPAHRRLYLRPLNDRGGTGRLRAGAAHRPSSREALEALSDLYARQNDTRKALAVTERLVEQETDPGKRMPFLIRLGALWEAAGDMRRAGVMLRRAVDESPRGLQSIGELARFHERNKELQARNVLLEGALSLLASDLRANPETSRRCER
jgi:tetratricopeptide (TPR) repeat protein